MDATNISGKNLPTVTVPKGWHYYFDRTPEQLERIRQADIASGNTHDSAGEPKLYPTVGSGYVETDTVCSVIKTRGITWDTWWNKPTKLIEVLATIDGVPRIIKVRDPRRVLK